MRRPPARLDASRSTIWRRYTDDRSRHLSHTRRHERRRPPGAAVRRPAARCRRARPGRPGAAGARARRARLRAHPQPRAARPGPSSSGREDPRDHRGAGPAALAGRAAGRRAGCRRLPPLHPAARRHAARPRRGGASPLRLRRLFREGQISRPLGHGILERFGEALGAGRSAARHPPARTLQGDVRSARRAARPVPGRRRRLAALPQRQGRSRRLRHPRHVRAVVHRRQRHPRRGRPQQPRDAAVGRVGRHGAERCRARPGLHRSSGRTLARARRCTRANLRAAYEDKRIAVPGTVFNAVLNRPDPSIEGPFTERSRPCKHTPPSPARNG